MVVLKPFFLATFVIANFAPYPPPLVFPETAIPALVSTQEDTKARTLAPQSINRGLDPGRWEFAHKPLSS